MFHVKPIIELEKRKQERKNKIMGYPNFGKNKTIVLPLDYEFIANSDGDTYEVFRKDYLKKYGIDLDDIVVFNADEITIKGFVLLQNTGNLKSYVGKNLIMPYMTYTSDSIYDEGVSDAKLTICIGNPQSAGFGIVLSVDKDATAFSKENCFVGLLEI